MGFIQKLPTQLVAAFRATLEEITEATLLLHVVDVSHPNAAAQTQAVMQVHLVPPDMLVATISQLLAMRCGRPPGQIQSLHIRFERYCLPVLLRGGTRSCRCSLEPTACTNCSVSWVLKARQSAGSIRVSHSPLIIVCCPMQ